jgi:hypothetical protein
MTKEKTMRFNGLKSYHDGQRDLEGKSVEVRSQLQAISDLRRIDYAERLATTPSQSHLPSAIGGDSPNATSLSQPQLDRIRGRLSGLSDQALERKRSDGEARLRDDIKYARARGYMQDLSLYLTQVEYADRGLDQVWSDQPKLPLAYDEPGENQPPLPGLPDGSAEQIIYELAQNQLIDLSSSEVWADTSSEDELAA